ncbi:hypothetical protein FKM82_005224 [Ascaphus truei]
MNKANGTWDRDKGFEVPYLITKPLLTCIHLVPHTSLILSIHSSRTIASQNKPFFRLRMEISSWNTSVLSAIHLVLYFAIASFFLSFEEADIPGP